MKIWPLVIGADRYYKNAWKNTVRKKKNMIKIPTIISTKISNLNGKLNLKSSFFNFRHTFLQQNLLRIFKRKKAVKT